MIHLGATTVVQLRPMVAMLAGFLLGAYELRYAWLILVRSEAPLLPVHRIALWVLRHTKGPVAARDRELQLTRPGSRRAEGLWSLVGGVILVLYGALNLIAVVLRWTPTGLGSP